MSHANRHKRIDVHHHFLADEYIASWGEEKFKSISAAGSVARWSVDLSLDLMEVSNTETSLLSVSSPGWPPGSPQQVRKLARACNELAATVVQKHPGRFGMFASLPLPSVDLALEEIAYCFDQLGAFGATLFTNYEGRHLGDPVNEPLFDELNRREAVVFVHPITPAGGKTLAMVSESMLDYPFETTRAIVSLLYHGTPQRYPKIKFVFSHAGGALPYLAGRVALFSELNPKFQQRGFEGVIPAVRDFYFDMADSVNAYTLGTLRALVPMDHLLFGSDIPFARKERIQLAVEGYAKAGFSDAELRCIERENALTLFPRLQGAGVAG
jgi:6-methylsalicylate decarboxylase